MKNSARSNRRGMQTGYLALEGFILKMWQLQFKVTDHYLTKKLSSGNGYKNWKWILEVFVVEDLSILKYITLQKTVPLGLSHLQEVTDVYKPPTILLILCFTIVQNHVDILGIQFTKGTFVCCYILAFSKNKRQNTQLTKRKMKRQTAE